MQINFLKRLLLTSVKAQFSIKLKLKNFEFFKILFDLIIIILDKNTKLLMTLKFIQTFYYMCNVWPHLIIIDKNQIKIIN